MGGYELENCNMTVVYCKSYIDTHTVLFLNLSETPPKYYDFFLLDLILSNFHALSKTFVTPGILLHDDITIFIKTAVSLPRNNSNSTVFRSFSYQI
jgi:hypothetical protein